MYIKLSSHSLACFWEKLRESSLDPLVSDALSEGTERIILSEWHLYFSTRLLRLCEEVSERPSPKEKNLKQRRAVFHTGIFS